MHIMPDLVRRFNTFVEVSDFRSERFILIRARLLNLILTRSIWVVSLAILVFGVDSWQRGRLIQVAVYILIFILYVVITFHRKMVYHRRAALLIFVLFLYGTGEFLWNGISGDGRMVMITLSGLSVMFLGLRPGLFCFGVSFLTQVIIGVGMPLGWIMLPERTDVSYSASLVDWQTGNIMFLACGGALLLCIVLIFEKLEKSLDSQRNLTEALEIERSSLQQRIVERTADLQREISERIQTEDDLRKSERQLRFLSTPDALTGLYNRAYFEEELTRISQVDAFPVTVIMADVDHLKQINDQNGHAAGDRILQATAEVLRSAFRKQDVIARIGGDEFVILLPQTGEEGVSEILRRVKTSLLEHPLQEEYAAPFNISLGSATAGDASLLHGALHVADLFMYEQKQNGRNGKA